MPTPQEVANAIANYVRAFVHLAFWAVVAAATAGAAYIGIQAVLWFVQMASNALGLGG